MRIAIAGSGIAGSYFANLLRKKGIEPDLFDAMDHGTSCGCRSCGWGAPEGIDRYLAEVGLAGEDYLLEPMPVMHFDNLVARTPLVTVDKPRLIRDLNRGTGLVKRDLGAGEAEAYDVVVDATGISRAFLPPCNADLTLPTLQDRVVVKNQESGTLAAGVYGNQVPGLGYVWVFPLGDNRYHIGAGGIGLDQLDTILDRFYATNAGQFSFTRLCRCHGVIRVASPYYSAPLFTRKTRDDGRSRLIIGVGESIGTVAPFTGEGIGFSLECAKVLAETWPDPVRYARAVLGRFAWMKKERETLDYLLSRAGKGGPRLRDRWRFFQSARRSGIGLPMLEAFRQIGTLSQWVEIPNREG